VLREEVEVSGHGVLEEVVVAVEEVQEVPEELEEVRGEQAPLHRPHQAAAAAASPVALR
jgi:hypothetical protein